MKQFESNVATIMKYLRSEGFSPSVLSAHRLCYQELLGYLTISGQDYSPEIAYQWIETNKSSWSYRKYTGYRHCIDQLEDIRKDGSISLDHLCFRKPAHAGIPGQIPCPGPAVEYFVFPGTFPLKDISVPPGTEATEK